MDDYVSRNEYAETVKRLEAEDTRENKRIGELEDTVKKINDLTISVNKLATNMENMLKVQTKQGERLDAIEGRDGEKWRTVVSYCLTVACGIIIGFIFTQIGIV